VVIDEVEAAFLRNHADVLQRVRQNQAEPDVERRRPRPSRRPCGDAA
jgi:hypothetical protein